MITPEQMQQSPHTWYSSLTTLWGHQFPLCFVGTHLQYLLNIYKIMDRLVDDDDDNCLLQFYIKPIDLYHSLDEREKEINEK